MRQTIEQMQFFILSLLWTCEFYHLPFCALNQREDWIHTEMFDFCSKLCSSIFWCKSLRLFWRTLPIGECASTGCTNIAGYLFGDIYFCPHFFAETGSDTPKKKAKLSFWDVISFLKEIWHFLMNGVFLSICRVSRWKNWQMNKLQVRSFVSIFSFCR